MSNRRRLRGPAPPVTVTGWRCWDISADGVLWSPLNYGEDVPWEPGPVRAICEVGGGHPVPDEGCSCGWRVMPALAAFVRSACTDAAGRPIDLDALDRIPLGQRPRCFVPKAVGQAVLGGRTYGAYAYGDPDGAVRGELAMVTGPLYLGSPFGCAAALTAERYGADVVVSGLSQPQWMRRAFAGGGGLAEDARLYEHDPAALGDRLVRASPAARAANAFLLGKMR